MFLILGLFGFLWAVLWHFNFRKETNPHRSALETGMNPNEKILKVIFTSPALLINCFVFFTFGYALFFALIWLPGFLEKSHGVTIARTGILVILPWAVSSITILLSGFLSDFLWKKKAHLRASRVYLIGFGMLFASFFFFGITLDNELEVDLILIALGLGSIFLANPPIYSLVADLSPHSTGTAQAVHSFFFALSGVISPAFTGWLVHATGHFRIPIFFVAGLSFLAGILSLCFQFPDKRPKHF
jgi:ACS family hexuronate transporter-like MFS transporter